MRAVFLGNHSVGVRVLNALSELGVLAGVVAHPPDPEDGARYLSVFDRAGELHAPRLRATGKDPALPDFVASCAPDLLVVADYRYLLPGSVIRLARLGAVNFHPGMLPAYRGRAPVNWAILRGESTLGLTLHWIDEGADTGDIIAQERFTLESGEDVGDALDKLYPLYDAMTRWAIPAIAAGRAPRLPQDHTLATEFPRRQPEDGLLDLTGPAQDALNLVRAVARPYPGAYAYCAETRILVWKARLMDADGTSHLPPGQVTTVDGRFFVVRCGKGSLGVVDWEAADPDWAPAVGMRLCGAARSRGEAPA